MANDFSAAQVKAVALPDVRDHPAAMGLGAGRMALQRLGAREKACSEAWVQVVRTRGVVVAR